MESLAASLSLTTPIKKQPLVGPTTVTPDRFHNPPTRTRTRNAALQLLELERGSDAELTRVGSPLRNIKGSDNATQILPQKFAMLCEFFDALVSSIRLLRLKGLSTTLTKLSRKIESLTDRRFSLHHLAQLKYIVPEVIVVKKIRVQDEETSCMKEELLISLETDAVQTDKDVRGYSHLKGIFHSRIVDYASTHPESDEVPEGELPELFYMPKQEPEPSMNHTSVLCSTALIAPSFKRRFSSRALSAPVTESSPSKQLLESPIKEAEYYLAKDEYSVSKIDIHATPVKTASIPSKLGSTPVEVVSTPARLMSATPVLRPPKRPRVTEDNPTGLPNNSAKRRVLKFDEHCDDIKHKSYEDSDDEIDVQVHRSAGSKGLLGVLPDNLLHSLMEKERKTLEEQDPVVLQAKRRQQLIAGVPKLFDMIQLLFQSIRCSVLTKEELIHKIITGHLDIVDKGEVEDQLKLLQEIAPELITELSCLSGDSLLRLNKSVCADSVRAKLLEGKMSLQRNLVRLLE